MRPISDVHDVHSSRRGANCHCFLLYFLFSLESAQLQGEVTYARRWRQISRGCGSRSRFRQNHDPAVSGRYPALAAAVGPFYQGLAEDILVNSLQRYRDAGLWATRPEVSRGGFARLAASLLSGGFVSRIHSYDNCVDQSLY